jgi:hypothetical protein
MSVYKKWSQNEIEYIRNNHVSVPDEELAVKLSQISGQKISTAMVRRQRRKLLLSKPRGRPVKKVLAPSEVGSDNVSSSVVSENGL